MVVDSLARRVVVGDSLVHLDPERDPCPCLLVADLLATEPTPPLAPVPYSKSRSVSTPCAQSASVLGDAVYGRGVGARTSQGRKGTPSSRRRQGRGRMRGTTVGA